MNVLVGNGTTMLGAIMCQYPKQYFDEGFDNIFLNILNHSWHSYEIYVGVSLEHVIAGRFSLERL